MQANAEEQTELTQYLLGRVPPESCGAIEERLLTDSEFYEELSIAEEELIDRYLANQLSDLDRQSFETHFITPAERQQKVRFARNLRRYVSEAALAKPDENLVPAASSERSDKAPVAPPKKRFPFSFFALQSPIFSHSLTALSLVVVVGLSWFVFTKMNNSSTQEGGDVLSVVLMPGVTRDIGNVQTINISSKTSTLELRLALERSDYPTYRVVLFAEDRSEVWSSDNLIPIEDVAGRFLAFRMPANSFTAPAYYRVKVTGRASDGSFEDVSSYSFRLMR